MRKILYVAALLLMSASTAMAEGTQQLTINGQTVESVVTRITFGGDNVVLQFSDGTSQTADMEAVVLGFDYSAFTSVYTLREAVGNFLNLSGVADGTEVCIYDAKGKLVAIAKADGTKAALSVSKLRSGVYLLKAGRQVVKFIKK